MNALIRWSIRYRGFVALLSVVWLVAGTLSGDACAARRFSGVRAAASHDPDRSPGPSSRAGRANHHPPDRSGGRRRTGHRQHAGRNRFTAFRSCSSPSMKALTRPSPRARDCRTAFDPQRQIASGFGPPKLTPLTSSTMDVLKLGIVSDRRRSLYAARRRRLDDQAATAGGARHRPRHRLRRRRPADSGSAEARPAIGTRPYRDGRHDGRERSHRATRRRRRRDAGAAHHHRNAAACSRSARHRAKPSSRCRTTGPSGLPTLRR